MPDMIARLRADGTRVEVHGCDLPQKLLSKEPSSTRVVINESRDHALHRVLPRFEVKALNPSSQTRRLTVVE
jgi:hypothetical protein